MEEHFSLSDIRYAFVKVGMTSIFNPDGSAQGVTVLKMQPAKILRSESLKDGRVVVVVEYDTGNKKKVVRGWVVPAHQSTAAQALQAGTPLQAPPFASGQFIKITGISKGRGFQDVVTRHGFGGGPASHGSRFHRAPGSVGMRTQPGRVMKGKKMPGHDGQDQVTMRHVRVAHWSQEDTVLAVAGGVPGARGSVVFI